MKVDSWKLSALAVSACDRGLWRCVPYSVAELDKDMGEEIEIVCCQVFPCTCHTCLPLVTHKYTGSLQACSKRWSLPLSAQEYTFTNLPGTGAASTEPGASNANPLDDQGDWGLSAEDLVAAKGADVRAGVQGGQFKTQREASRKADAGVIAGRNLPHKTCLGNRPTDLGNDTGTCMIADGGTRFGSNHMVCAHRELGGHNVT